MILKLIDLEDGLLIKPKEKTKASWGSILWPSRPAGMFPLFLIVLEVLEKGFLQGGLIL